MFSQFSALRVLTQSGRLQNLLWETGGGCDGLYLDPRPQEGNVGVRSHHGKRRRCANRPHYSSPRARGDAVGTIHHNACFRTFLEGDPLARGVHLHAGGSHHCGHHLRIARFERLHCQYDEVNSCIVDGPECVKQRVAQVVLPPATAPERTRHNRSGCEFNKTARHEEAEHRRPLTQKKAHVLMIWAVIC